MTVFKRGKTWAFRIDIGKDKQTGKRKQLGQGGFKTKKEALAAELECKNEVAKGEYFKPSKELFKVHFTNWFNTVYRRTVKEQTAEARWSGANKHILLYFGEMMLSEITPLELDEFYSIKMDEGLAPATIRHLHSLLNGAFKQAVKWRLLKINPVNDASPPVVKNKKKNPLTLEQVLQFLELAYQKNRGLPPFITAIYTGARRGEVLGLKWDDVDFDKQTIHIQRSLKRIKGKGLVFSDLKTSGSDRYVAISPIMMELFKKEKARQEQVQLNLKGLFQHQGLIHCTDSGMPLDPKNTLDTLMDFIKEAGVPKITFHDLRHVHATLLMGMGENPKIVAERLGHSRVQVTLDFYSHSNVEMQRKRPVTSRNF